MRYRRDLPAGCGTLTMSENSGAAFETGVCIGRFPGHYCLLSAGSLPILKVLPSRLTVLSDIRTVRGRGQRMKRETYGLPFFGQAS